MAGGREVVINYEFVRGHQNETVVKKLCVASSAASVTFHFKSPYKMADHGSLENGLKWADGRMEYKELHTVITEAVANYSYLYAYGSLAGLTRRPIYNPEDLQYPHTSLSFTNAGVHCHVANFPNLLAQPKPRIPSTIG